MKTRRMAGEAEVAAAAGLRTEGEGMVVGIFVGSLLWIYIYREKKKSMARVYGRRASRMSRARYLGSAKAVNEYGSLTFCVSRGLRVGSEITRTLSLLRTDKASALYLRREENVKREKKTRGQEN